MFLPTVRGDELRIAACVGPVPQEALRQVRVPVGQGHAGRVFSSCRTEVDNAVTSHFKSVDDETGFVTRQMATVPLVHLEQAKGVIQLINRDGGFGEREGELLALFAEQAALAVRNAELFEKLLGTSGLLAKPSVRERFVERLRQPSAGMVSEPEDFAILYVDMRGFTKLCESLGNQSHAIKPVLDDYFRMLTEHATSRDGIVNKFIGDGMVAVFPGPARFENAVQAAFGIVEAFPILRERWGEDTPVSLGFLDVGIGITMDRLFFGQIGGDRCYDVSAIGEGLGHASLLANNARDGKRILCAKHFLKAGEWRERLSWVSAEELEPIPTKPGDKAIGAFQLTTAPGADVFLSYRRAHWQNARLVRAELEKSHRVFLDVIDLRNGDFAEALLHAVSTSKNFVVLLTKDNLERWQSPDDWVRKEIAHALANEVNVVPVMWGDFEFPAVEELPEEIRGLPGCNAIRCTHETYEGAVGKLREFLVGGG